MKCWDEQNPIGVSSADYALLEKKGRNNSGSDAPEAGRDHTYNKRDTETLKEATQPEQSPLLSPPPISGQHKIQNAPVEEPSHPQKKRRRWLLPVTIVLVVLTIMGIALGVGLGVGLKKHNSKSE